MTELNDLWRHYGHRARPTNIGDIVDGIALGELDDEIQDVVSSYFGMGAELGTPRVARLGIALADLTRVLPNITPAATQDYFGMVESLARATLDALATEADV